MPSSTMNHGITYPIPADLVKDPAQAAKLARDLQALAVSTDAALTASGAAASAAAGAAEAGAKAYTDTTVAGVRADAQGWADDAEAAANAYTDVSFAASGPGGATDEQLDAAVDRAVLAGRIKQTHVVSVRDYGAKGDGGADDMAAIQAAIDAAPPGGTVVFPAGVYAHAASHRSDPDDAGWVRITKPLTLRGEAGAVVQHPMWLVQGAPGPFVPVSAPSASGDRSVTAAGHGLKAGDWVQLASEYSVYSPDAGEWQLGSENPTSGSRPTCRASEIRQVQSVDGDVVTFMAPLLYRYGTSVTGFAHPIPGVSTSEIRALNPVDGVVIEGIEFDLSSEVAGKETLLFRQTANVTVRNCVFRCNARNGGYVIATESVGFVMESCRVEHPIVSFSGSAMNAVLFGGGSTNVTIRDNVFSRGAQIIDVITNHMSQAGRPGGQTSVVRSDYATCQDIGLHDNTFYDCGEAFTSHPATVGVLVAGNRLHACGTGFRLRGMRQVATGNLIEFSRAGVTASAFTSGLNISGNVFRIRTTSERPVAWAGVSVDGVGAEIRSNNATKNVVVAGNTIYGEGSTAEFWGIRFTHSRSGYAGFTSEEKVRLSDITVHGNVLRDCSVRVENFMNGVKIIGNTIDGSTTQTDYIIVDDDAAAARITSNVLGGGGGIRTGGTTLTGYEYPPEHRIGPHVWLDGAAALSTPGAVPMTIS